MHTYIHLYILFLFNYPIFPYCFRQYTLVCCASWQHIHTYLIVIDSTYVHTYIHTYIHTLIQSQAAEVKSKVGQRYRRMGWHGNGSQHITVCYIHTYIHTYHTYHTYIPYIHTYIPYIPYIHPYYYYVYQNIQGP